ncbi:MAG: asparagine synthase-related protein [Anaerobacillus sp.]|uniref:asparagine synthase-related protein n=1 Tax=Anaerobacillus sp. TaxID=1872506 RepID=UPI0039199CA8
MAAITGIIHFNNKPVPSDHVSNMMKVLNKYPADDVQVWIEDSVFLGCHNQWITPEAIGEKVPYFDYQRKLVITADAIIDNREELYTKLNIHINDLPDSHLILLAYEKWGEDVVKHLIGDYAFMIWDEKQKKLFGARDFSGARTLYFFSHHNLFAFSTIIEPLFTLPYVEKKISEEWLAEFIAIPNMVEAVDMFATVYENINQIPPAHTVTVISGNVKFKRYCNLGEQSEIRLKNNYEYEEMFRDVFKTAVRSRLRTYGKVGAQLSGGLDSGSVVSVAAKELKKENKMLHTFSYIPTDNFNDWTSKYFIADERPFIRATVDHVGNIQDQYLPFNGKDSYSELDDFLAIMEMPYKFFENTVWLKGINESAQQQGIKVLLNGARGNHSISWGSLSITLDYYANLFKKLRFFKLYNQLNLYCNNYSTGKSVMIPAVARLAFSQLINKNKEEEVRPPLLINSTFAIKTKVFEKLQQYGMDQYGNFYNQTDYRKSHFEQLHTWNKTGVATTKLSLRYSLWDRDPSNDIRVISFCLAVPEEQYSIEGLDRSLVRRATKGYLPDKVRMNYKVRGVQSADLINRMLPVWNVFIEEIEMLTRDSMMSEILNVKLIKDALKAIKEPRPDLVFESDFRILTRSLVIYRFIKDLERR